jgi:uncharacterized protein (DUF433 family)
MVADGMTTEETLRDFPQFELEDIQEALRFALAAVDQRDLPLRPAG